MTIFLFISSLPTLILIILKIILASILEIIVVAVDVLFIRVLVDCNFYLYFIERFIIAFHSVILLYFIFFSLISVILTFIMGIILITVAVLLINVLIDFNFNLYFIKNLITTFHLIII